MAHSNLRKSTSSNELRYLLSQSLLKTWVVGSKTWCHLRFSNIHLGYLVFNVTCTWLKRKNVVFKKKNCNCYQADYQPEASSQNIALNLLYNNPMWDSISVHTLHTQEAFTQVWNYSEFQCLLKYKSYRLDSVEESKILRLFHFPSWLLLLLILMRYSEAGLWSFTISFVISFNDAGEFLLLV